jgi:hypothetical protein
MRAARRQRLRKTAQPVIHGGGVARAPVQHEGGTLMSFGGVRIAVGHQRDWHNLSGRRFRGRTGGVPMMSTRSLRQRAVAAWMLAGAASFALGWPVAAASQPASAPAQDPARLAAAFDKLMQRAAGSDVAIRGAAVVGREITIGAHRVRFTPRHEGVQSTPGRGLWIVGVACEVAIDGQPQPQLGHSSAGVGVDLQAAEQEAIAAWYGNFGRTLLFALGGSRPAWFDERHAVYASLVSIQNGSQGLANDELLQAERMLAIVRSLLPAAATRYQAVHLEAGYDPRGALKTRMIVNGVDSDAGAKLLAAEPWPPAPKTATGPWYVARRTYVLAPAAERRAVFDDARLTVAFDRVMQQWMQGRRLAPDFTIEGRDLVAGGKRVQVKPQLEQVQPAGSQRNSTARVRFEVAIDGQPQPRLTQDVLGRGAHPEEAQTQALTMWHATVGHTILAAASGAEPTFKAGPWAVYAGVPDVRSAVAVAQDDPLLAPKRAIEAVAALLPAPDGRLHAVHLHLIVLPTGEAYGEVRIDDVHSPEAAKKLGAMPWPKSTAPYLVSRTFTLR